MRPIPATRLGDAHGLLRAIEQRGRLRTDEFVTEFNLDELFPPGLENAVGRMRHFISFGRLAGLVKEDRGVVELTDIGKRYVRSGDPAAVYDVSSQQAEWLRRQLRERHMTDSIFHGLAIGLSLLASVPAGTRISTMDFGRSMAYLGRAGWDNENTLRIQGERHLTLLGDLELIDAEHRLTATGEQIRAELTLPVHMSLPDIAAQLNTGGAEAVRAAAVQEFSAPAAPHSEPTVEQLPDPTPVPDRPASSGYRTVISSATGGAEGRHSPPPVVPRPESSPKLPPDPNPAGPDPLLPFSGNRRSQSGLLPGDPLGLAPATPATQIQPTPPITPGSPIATNPGSEPALREAAPPAGTSQGPPSTLPTAAPLSPPPVAEPAPASSAPPATGESPAASASAPPATGESSAASASAPPATGESSAASASAPPATGTSSAPPAAGESSAPPISSAPPVAGESSAPPIPGESPAPSTPVSSSPQPAAPDASWPLPAADESSAPATPVSSAPPLADGSPAPSVSPPPAAEPAPAAPDASSPPPVAADSPAAPDASSPPVAEPAPAAPDASSSPPTAADSSSASASSSSPVADGLSASSVSSAPPTAGESSAPPVAEPAEPTPATRAEPARPADPGRPAFVDVATIRAAAIAAGLRLPAGVYANVAAALSAGKHLLLTGTPGSGKTALAMAIARAASQEGKASGATVVTGDPRDLIPEAAAQGRWLIVDELDQADVRDTYAPLSSFLDGVPVTFATGEATPAEDWRLIATWNGDAAPRAAVLRRFAVIALHAPGEEELRAAIKHAAHDDATATAGAEKLLHFADRVGTGVLLDAARHAAARQAAVPTDPDTLAQELVTAYIAPLIEP